MKLKILSMLLAVTLLFQISAQAAYASSELEHIPNIYHYASNEKEHTVEAVTKVNQSEFYSFRNDYISYCAQIVSNESVQFSYYIPSDDILIESSLYAIDDIYTKYSLDSNSDDHFLELNRNILYNLADFTNVNVVCKETTIENNNLDIASLTAFNDLTDAITDMFGTNYHGQFKGISGKTYNGINYTVQCTESQSTTNSTIDSRWFAKSTALTAILAWATATSWTWQTALASIITTVISTMIVNGVEKTINDFTAQRTDVTVMNTRIVTVNGYTGTHYWAGWTRKVYFFKGEFGWVSDHSPHYDFKHDDYDDVSGLMSTGWRNFVNTVLGGDI